MIKLILEEHYTKRDISGNVYHVVRVMNTQTGNSFITETPSLGNVRGIVQKYLNLEWNEIHEVSICTNSSRISSLPKKTTKGYINCCHIDDNWKKELFQIGFKEGGKYWK